VVVVALGLSVVSLAVAAAAVLVREPAPSIQAVGPSALEAARARTATLTSYDHRTLDADFAAVLATATGEFAREYRATTEQLRPTFLRTRAVAAAEVVAAGLESVQAPADGPQRAVAVVAVDQVITTAGAPPRTERNRLRMALVRWSSGSSGSSPHPRARRQLHRIQARLDVRPPHRHPVQHVTDAALRGRDPASTGR